MPLIPFIKMHGLGNDFVIVDDRKDEYILPFNRLNFLADRKRGIGFDQFIVLKRSVRADVFMQILNADNSEVDACGNATRCVAWMIAEQKNVPHVTIETNAGILSADITGHQRVRVDMGKPSFEWNKIPLAKNVNVDAIPIDIEGLSLPVGVSMGNPHAVFFTEGEHYADLAEFGPRIEHHELFPERVNVSVATILHADSPSRLRDKPDSPPRLRGGQGGGSKETVDTAKSAPLIIPVGGMEGIQLNVWERGVGLTEACGTAACAALVAAVKTGRIAAAQHGEPGEVKNIHRLDSLENNDVPWANVYLPGGRLRIEWDKNQSGHVFMSGDVATSFYGAF